LCTRFITVNNLTLGICDIQAGQIAFENPAILFLQHNFIFEPSFDELRLMVNPLTQNDYSPENHHREDNKSG
jgi:hypothetical protein